MVRRAREEGNVVSDELEWGTVFTTERELVPVIRILTRDGWTLRAVTHHGARGGFLTPPPKLGRLVLVVCRPRAVSATDDEPSA